MVLFLQHIHHHQQQQQASPFSNCLTTIACRKLPPQVIQYETSNETYNGKLRFFLSCHTISISCVFFKCMYVPFRVHSSWIYMRHSNNGLIVIKAVKPRIHRWNGTKKILRILENRDFAKKNTRVAVIVAWKIRTTQTTNIKHSPLSESGVCVFFSQRTKTKHRQEYCVVLSFLSRFAMWNARQWVAFDTYLYPSKCVRLLLLLLMVLFHTEKWLGERS